MIERNSNSFVENSFEMKQTENVTFYQTRFKALRDNKRFVTMSASIIYEVQHIIYYRIVAIRAIINARTGK